MKTPLVLSPNSAKAEGALPPAEPPTHTPCTPRSAMLSSQLSQLSLPSKGPRSSLGRNVRPSPMIYSLSNPEEGSEYFYHFAHQHRQGSSEPGQTARSTHHYSSSSKTSPPSPTSYTDRPSHARSFKAMPPPGSQTERPSTSPTGTEADGNNHRTGVPLVTQVPAKNALQRVNSLVSVLVKADQTRLEQQGSQPLVGDLSFQHLSFDPQENTPGGASSQRSGESSARPPGAEAQERQSSSREAGGSRDGSTDRSHRPRWSENERSENRAATPSSRPRTPAETPAVAAIRDLEQRLLSGRRLRPDSKQEKRREAKKMSTIQAVREWWQSPNRYKIWQRQEAAKKQPGEVLIRDPKMVDWVLEGGGGGASGMEKAAAAREEQLRKEAQAKEARQHRPARPEDAARAAARLSVSTPSHSIRSPAKPPPPGNYEEALKANPEASDVKKAADAAMRHRLASAHARTRYEHLQQHPGDANLNQAFFDAKQDLRWARPFFVAPKAERERHSRAESPTRLPPIGGLNASSPFAMTDAERERFSMAQVTPDQTPRRRRKNNWNLDMSIFLARKFESDGKGFYDNEAVKKKRLRSDWSHTANKARFKDVVKRAITLEKGSSRRSMQAAGTPRTKEEVAAEAALDAEMLAIRNTIEQDYNRLNSAFTFFSQTAPGMGESVYTLGLNGFTEFLRASCVVDNNSEFCKQHDLDTMFIATNQEDEAKNERQKQLNKINQDRSLMRFEFLEILVRIAVAKYRKTKQVATVSEAVALLTSELIATLAPEAMIDTNQFRRERLYSESVDQVLKAHQPLLQAMYKMVKPRHKKYLPQENWFALLQMTGLIGAHTGISQREAKLVFAWSQMVVVDEFGSRDKLLGLTFVEFLEALCRTAELLSPPEEADLDSYFTEDVPRVPEEDRQRGMMDRSRIWLYYNEVNALEAEERRRPSAGLMQQPSRPLAVKVESTIEVMMHSLMHRFGKCRSEAELVLKVDGAKMR